MDTLDLFRTEPAPEGACIACKKFAAGKRDHRGFLMRTGRGYCDWPAHPGGQWNVIQSITNRHRCDGFEPEDDVVVQKRREWIEKHRGHE